MDNSKQHIQIPNRNENNLKPKDLLVYATIKRFMNNTTKECFPSIDTIVRLSGISKPTVIKSTKLLEQEGYLSIRKSGKKNIYKFNKYKTFEVFSYQFLDIDIVSEEEKSYVIASQQYMFKDIEGFGKMSYSNSELSKLINLDKDTIKKYDKSLEDKGLLTVVKTNKLDETGILVNEKFFHLNELGQSVIWSLQKHNDDIEDLKKKNESLTLAVNLMAKEIRLLKGEEEIKDQFII